jgi:hypothetical protein
MSARQKALEEAARATGVLISICCYCEALLGATDVAPGLEGLSHGACDTCKTRVLEELRARRTA